ncbi:hypothetical protein ACOMHN_033020 [Nucella lapillus]
MTTRSSYCSLPTSLPLCISLDYVLRVPNSRLKVFSQCQGPRQPSKTLSHNPASTSNQWHTANFPLQPCQVTPTTSEGKALVPQGHVSDAHQSRYLSPESSGISKDNSRPRHPPISQLPATSGTQPTSPMPCSSYH